MCQKPNSVTFGQAVKLAVKQGTINRGVIQVHHHPALLPTAISNQNQKYPYDTGNYSSSKTT
jgi:hypothetical protein